MKAIDEKLIDAMSRKKREWWLNNRAVIETADGEEKTILEAGGLKRGQRMINALRHHCRFIWKEPIRILTLKSRQIGLSTDEQAFQYWESKYEGRSGCVIAHKQAASEYLFEKFMRYHERDRINQPKLKLSNVRRVLYSDRPGRYEVGTAGSPDAFRSRTYQNIHGSEVAYWGDDGPRLDRAIQKFVQRRIMTSVNYETTANSEDPIFYPMWENAVKHVSLEFIRDDTLPFGFRVDREVDDPHGKWNGFYPLFIGAQDDEKCYLPCNKKEAQQIYETLSEEETWIVDTLNLPVEFLKWRRVALATECRGDINDLHQEYPITAKQAFISSGNPRFRHDILDMMPVEQGRKGYLRQKQGYSGRYDFVSDNLGDLIIFRRPERGHRYILGCDPSQGIPSENPNCPHCSGSTDEASIQVYDIDAQGKIEQAAQIFGPHDEDWLVDPIISLATYYNGAYCVIENNGGYGEHINVELSKRYFPERIYRIPGKKKAGLPVNIGNRTRLLNDLAATLHENTLIVHSERTIHQLKVTQRIQGSKHDMSRAATGHHDDDVASLWAVVQGLINYPQALDPIYSKTQRRTNPFLQRQLPLDSDYNPDPKGFY